MANWVMYEVKRVISEIEQGRFVLPVIQRNLVWDESKMVLLFDTLLKGNSFGGIITIEENIGTKPLFNYRKFSKDGITQNTFEQEHNLDKTIHLVIDGQQRLQTFYIGLLGTFENKHLYFDIYSDDDMYDFQFAETIDKLPSSVKELENRNIQERFWYKVTDLYNKLLKTHSVRQVATNIKKTYIIDDEKKNNKIEDNLDAFYQNVIAQDSIGISTVIVSQGLENDESKDEYNKQRIVELFRRLNDGGTKLDTFDLVASKLKAYNWKMESFLNNILSKQKKYNAIGLSQDNLIKLLFILQDNHKKEMVAVEQSDAQFALDNEKRIESSLESLYKFLQASKLIAYYDKDYNRSFVPLFFIIYHMFHKNISNSNRSEFFRNFDSNNPEFTRMYKWLYYSLINGVFRSRGAGWTPYRTGIKKILEIIKDHKNSDFPIDELFNVYKEHGVQFTDNLSSTDLNTYDFDFMFYLIYDREATIRKQDIDHIHPRSILQKCGYDWDKINHSANYQLIDYSTNRGEKSDKPFNEWLTKHVNNPSGFKTKHLIPADESTYLIENYDSFLSKRTELINKKILKYVENK